MPCILAILILAFPRVVLVLMYLFTNIIERAYNGLLIPLLGFIFLPITTIVYALLIYYKYPISGIYLLGLIIAVILDVGSWGGSARRG